MKTLKCTAEVGKEICEALGIPEEARVAAIDLNMVAGEPMTVTVRLDLPADCLARLGEVLSKYGSAG